MASRFSNIVRNDDKILEFDISNIDVSVVNSIRRVLQCDIPNVALLFDVHDIKKADIIINKNTSPMHNEFLSQRISLCPLHFTRDEIKTYEKLRYKFVLKKKNTDKINMLITTDDVEIYDEFTNEAVTREFRDRIFPKDMITKDPTIITVLKPDLSNPNEGGEVDVEAYATVGTANDHTCYSPISCAVFYNLVDEDSAIKVEENAKKAYDKANAEKAEQSKEFVFSPLDKQRCYYKNEYGEPSRFHFKIETECALRPVDMFGDAIDILIQKCTRVVNGILEKDEEVVRIVLGEPNELIQMIIYKETHTIGNLLQAMLYNFQVRDKKVLKYIGYNCPHPLQMITVLKIAFVDQEHPTLEKLQQFLTEGINEIIDSLTEFKKDWMKENQGKIYV